MPLSEKFPPTPVENAAVHVESPHARMVNVTGLVHVRPLLADVVISMWCKAGVMVKPLHPPDVAAAPPNPQYTAGEAVAVGLKPVTLNVAVPAGDMLATTVVAKSPEAMLMAAPEG